MRRRMDRALDLIHAADGPVYVKKYSNHVGPSPYLSVAAWIGRGTFSMRPMDPNFSKNDQIMQVQALIHASPHG